MLESHVSHLPEQSALQSVHRLDSVGFPRLIVPIASFLLSNLISVISSAPFFFRLNNANRHINAKRRLHRWFLFPPSVTDAVVFWGTAFFTPL
jgi:hypothetical protein